MFGEKVEKANDNEAKIVPTITTFRASYLFRSPAAIGPEKFYNISLEN